MITAKVLCSYIYKAQFLNTPAALSNKTVICTIATVHNTYMHITIITQIKASGGRFATTDYNLLVCTAVLLNFEVFNK